MPPHSSFTQGEKLQNGSSPQVLNLESKGNGIHGVFYSVKGRVIQPVPRKFHTELSFSRCPLKRGEEGSR